MKFRAAALLTLLSLLATGCDIAGEARIGDPINPPVVDLDPDLDENLAGFFYLDRPVVGLRYKCTATTLIFPIVAATNTDGRFVCPRVSTITFFVGSEAEPLVLGTLELSIFGGVDQDTGGRNYVTVTPSTLYGTTADGELNEVANIHNLLTALDVGGGARQAVITLSAPLHEALGDAGLGSTLPITLSMEPDDFVDAVEPLLALVNAEDAIDLLMGGVMLPGSGPGSAPTLASAAIQRSRYGLYRQVLLLAQNTSTEQVGASVRILLARNGHMSGIATAVRASSGGGTIAMNNYQLAPGASILANGVLSGVTFNAGPGQSLAFAGRLVNDTVWARFGGANPLDAVTNPRIPEQYIYSASDLGSFTLNGGELTGDASLTRVVESQPDVELDVLPGEDPVMDGTLFTDNSPGAYLPLDLALTFRGYKDGRYVSPADKPTPAALGPTTTTLRLTILENGDIVSDVDGDCRKVDPEAMIGTQYYDADGTPEYVIGQVGGVFEAEETAYITLLLAIYEPAHPQYGLTLGMEAMGMQLNPVVLNTRTGKLVNKLCGTAAGCTLLNEWFNDVVFNTILRGDILDGDPATNTDIYKVETYYGRVTESNPVCYTPITPP